MGTAFKVEEQHRKGTEAEKSGSCSGPCLQLLLIYNELSRETESKHFKNLYSNLKE